MSAWRIVVTVSREDNAAKPFEVSFDSSPVSIGALATNDLVLNEPRVSGDHTLLTLSRGVLIVSDLSRNGTFVDGQRIKNQILGPQGVITIPPFRLLCRVVSEATEDRRTLEADLFSEVRGSVFLEVRTGPPDALHKRFALPAAGVRVGRSPEADLALNVATLSRFHAEIRPAEVGFWSVRDLKSSNGTFVNGKRVNESPLFPGDQIGLGVEVILAFGVASRPESSVKQFRGGPPDRSLQAPMHAGAAGSGGQPDVTSPELPPTLRTARQPLRIETSRAEKDIVVVSVAGRVDGYNYTELAHVLDRLADDKERAVLVNLERLTFIDHTGLGVLVKAMVAIEAYKGQLRLASVDERLHETFSLSRLDVVFRGKVMTDQQSAIADLLRFR